MSASSLTVGSPELFERFRTELSSASAEGRGWRGFRDHGEGRVYLKYAPLRGKAAWRHAARRNLLGRRLPRIQEYENLSWLCAHGFEAPRPLLAGAFFRGRLPCLQFLCVAALEGRPTLREFLAHERAPEARAGVIRHLGAEVARLHATGFVHRDLFPRNLLVQTRPRPGVAFLDAWRGGPPSRSTHDPQHGPWRDVWRDVWRNPWRGRRYDLACLLLFAPELLERSEERILLEGYAGGGAEDRPPRAALENLWRDLPAVARARRGLAQRFASRRRPESRLSAPVLEWEPPELGD